MEFDSFGTNSGLGLYKQLLGYLVVMVTRIEQMCCLLWWQMLEIAFGLQFQVKIAHQLLLSNFVVNIWYATLLSEILLLTCQKKKRSYF